MKMIKLTLEDDSYKGRYFVSLFTHNILFMSNHFNIDKSPYTKVYIKDRSGKDLNEYYCVKESIDEILDMVNSRDYIKSVPLEIQNRKILELGDKVLVRNFSDEPWKVKIFGHFDDSGKIATCNGDSISSPFRDRWNQWVNYKEGML